VIGDPDYEQYLEDIVRPMVFTHHYNGVETLYIGRKDDNLSLIEGTTSEFKVTQVFDEIYEHNGYYHHNWKQGDTVIWDNDQVMHKSAADFEGKRLLLRVQVRI
jgi:alpha-ketoglutarate-dependent taurine dioxygenase